MKASEAKMKEAIWRKLTYRGMLKRKVEKQMARHKKNNEWDRRAIEKRKGKED